MIDMIKVQELAALPDKEARAALKDYAAEFGIKLARTQKVPTMIKVIEEEIAKQETVTVEGVELSWDVEVEDTEQEFAAEPVVTVITDEHSTTEITEYPDRVELVHTDYVPVAEIPVEVELSADVFDEPEVESVGEPVEQVEEVQASVIEYPLNFRPMPLLGRNPKHINLPYWILDWIYETDGWMHRIKEYNKPDWKWLYHVAYYIENQGSVVVRDSRNSHFHTLR